VAVQTKQPKGQPHRVAPTKNQRATRRKGAENRKGNHGGVAGQKTTKRATTQGCPYKKPKGKKTARAQNKTKPKGQPHRVAPTKKEATQREPEGKRCGVAYLKEMEGVIYDW
jgi:hypothetical protein